MIREMESSPVKTTDMVFRILETLQEMDGGRVSEVARELEISNSTAHRHLKALKMNEYVIQEGDFYYVGLRFLEIAETARTRKKAYRLAQSKVEQLAQKTGERTEFLVEEFGRVVFVYQATGEEAVRANSYIGKRLPMHATSAGKVILAYLPEPRVQDIIAKFGLPSFTENTITNEDELYEEIEEIRERSVGFTHGDYVKGLNTLSVPVFEPHGQICGSLGISGPKARMKGNRLYEELPDLLLGTANELEINLAYSDRD